MGDQVKEVIRHGEQSERQGVIGKVRYKYRIRPVPYHSRNGKALSRYALLSLT